MKNKILLVDDEKGIVTMMKNYFEMSGYQVYSAYDGKEAIEKVACQPDIIFCLISICLKWTVFLFASAFVNMSPVRFFFLLPELRARIKL